MSSSELSNILVATIADKFTDGNVNEFVSFLQDSGLIEGKGVIRYIVKDEYYKRLKVGDKSGFDIKMDLAVEYDLSFDKISYIIYKSPHVTV
jgi:hypothetical protein